MPYKRAGRYNEKKSFSENPRDSAPRPVSSFDPDCLVGDISDIQRDEGGCDRHHQVVDGYNHCVVSAPFLAKLT